MDFLKRLFGNNGATRDASAGDATGVYFYVRPNGCDEVVRVRVDRNNDLSLADDGSTYWVRKGVRGTKCRQPVELTIYFDSSRRLTSTDAQNGVLVTHADYTAWLETQASS